MFRNITFLFTFSIYAFAFNAEAYNITELGSFSISFPAFTNIYKRLNASGFGQFDLLISTFNANPFSIDSVQIVEDIGNLVQNISSIETKVLTAKVTWPNEVSWVPEPYFNRSLVAIPDGFLVPFKTDGSISIMDISQDPPKGPYAISNGTGWFYHRVIWKDMDKDGDMDILTCRAKQPISGIGNDAELLWFENSNNLQSVWKSHVIDHGPDIYFRNTFIETPDGNKDCIITAQFFTHKLAIYWTNAANDSWVDVSQVKSRVIDDTIGGVFEVQTADLNADGKLDLLVTNNGNNGSLFAYEIPNDFRTENFARHTLASGFSPRQQMRGKGAPGAPKAIFPFTNVTNGTKPSILLSGDDDGKAYLLQPESTNTSDWNYNITTFLNTGDGTVGELSYADVDEDGYNEVFVPSYTTNEVFVFKFVK